jgi:hypothetical protein
MKLVRYKVPVIGMFAIFLYIFLQISITRTNYSIAMYEKDSARQHGHYIWESICMNERINIPKTGKDGSSLCNKAEMDMKMDVPLYAKEQMYGNLSVCVWSCESMAMSCINAATALKAILFDMSWKMMVVTMGVLAVGGLGMVIYLVMWLSNLSKSKTDKWDFMDVGAADHYIQYPYKKD